MTQHAPCTCNIFMLDWQSRDLMLSVSLESFASARGGRIYWCFCFSPRLWRETDLSSRTEARSLRIFCSISNSARHRQPPQRGRTRYKITQRERGRVEEEQRHHVACLRSVEPEQKKSEEEKQQRQLPLPLSQLPPLTFRPIQEVEKTNSYGEAYW